jgi:DNA repair photolyase
VKNAWRDLPETTTLQTDFPILGTGKTIFVGHLCDMFADGIKEEEVIRVLSYCRNSDNEYVFQTKNPQNLWHYLDWMPAKRMIGTTIETNRADILEKISKAPHPMERANGLGQIDGKKFLTIEPIIDFDVWELTELIKVAKPDFVNIGADSKRHNLPEPSGEKIMALVESLGKAGITIRKKVNIERLLKS